MGISKIKGHKSRAGGRNKMWIEKSKSHILSTTRGKKELINMGIKDLNCFIHNGDILLEEFLFYFF